MNEGEVFAKFREMWGEIRQPYPKDDLKLRRNDAHKRMAEEFNAFLEKPSSVNFLAMKYAMLMYQYWFQRKTYDEVEE